MRKKVLMMLLSGMMGVQLSGCVAILAGTTGGAGTAVWLSHKLVQEVDASFERSLKAARAALSSLKLDIKKETKKEDVAQLKSEYYDSKTVWVDIHKTDITKSRIEVRVGIKGDEIAARKILDEIIKRL